MPVVEGRSAWFKEARYATWWTALLCPLLCCSAKVKFHDKDRPPTISCHFWADPLAKGKWEGERECGVRVRRGCEEAGMERWRDREWMLTNSGCPGDWVHYFSFEEPSVWAEYLPSIRPSPSAEHKSWVYIKKKKKKRASKKMMRMKKKNKSKLLPQTK